MKSRRKFVKKIGLGALSAYALPGINALASDSADYSSGPEDSQIRIGIIGAENSHTVGFGKMFNIEKKFPGCEVRYVWGETEAFAQRAVTEGAIPNMVKDPLEMLGKIDALIIDHRHAKFHLPAALPFVKEGIPAFIDKPFCYRTAEGKEFLEIARKANAPVTSYSTIAHTDVTLDLRKQIDAMEGIQHVIRYGIVSDIHSQWGGVFFYGVHTIQPLMYMFGEDIERVRVSENGGNYTASLAFGSGLMATLIFTKSKYEWKTFVVQKNETMELASQVNESDPPKCYSDMVEMFRTGKEPRTHQSILNCVSVLEALEKSVESRKWEEPPYVTI